MNCWIMWVNHYNLANNWKDPCGDDTPAEKIVRIIQDNWLHILYVS